MPMSQSAERKRMRRCDVRHCISGEIRSALSDGKSFYADDGTRLDGYFYELPGYKEAFITLLKVMTVIFIIGFSFYLAVEII